VAATLRSEAERHGAVHAGTGQALRKGDAHCSLSCVALCADDLSFPGTGVVKKAAR